VKRWFAEAGALRGRTITVDFAAGDGQHARRGESCPTGRRAPRRHRAAHPPPGGAHQAPGAPHRRRRPRFMVTWGRPGVSNVDLQQAARVPPFARQAGDASPPWRPAGPLRPPRLRRRPDRGVRREAPDRRGLDQTAPFFVLEPGVFDYIAGRRHHVSSASRCRNLAKDGPADGPTGTTTSGSAWTPCATASALEDLWSTGAPWEDVAGLMGDHEPAAAGERRSWLTEGAWDEPVARLAEACPCSATPCGPPPKEAAPRRTEGRPWSCATPPAPATCGTGPSTPRWWPYNPAYEKLAAPTRPASWPT